MNLKKIKQKINKFVKDRDWEQFHSPKNLSMALSVEVSELVEIFQWLKDSDIKKYKKFTSPFNFKQRKEILNSIKYVSKVIKADYFITEEFLIKNKIDYLIHGSDNKNSVPKKYLKIFRRTKNISSTKLRKKIQKNIDLIFN